MGTGLVSRLSPPVLGCDGIPAAGNGGAVVLRPHRLCAWPCVEEPAGGPGGSRCGEPARPGAPEEPRAVASSGCFRKGRTAVEKRQGRGGRWTLRPVSLTGLSSLLRGGETGCGAGVAKRFPGGNMKGPGEKALRGRTRQEGGGGLLGGRTCPREAGPRGRARPCHGARRSEPLGDSATAQAPAGAAGNSHVQTRRLKMSLKGSAPEQRAEPEAPRARRGSGHVSVCRHHVPRKGT